MIKTHKELAAAIKGKKILHLNSLGKDSILCLDWLMDFAEPSEVVSLHYYFFAPHPGDEVYKKYLTKKFPTVKFIEHANPLQVSFILGGMFQDPIQQMRDWNHTEHYEFSSRKCNEDLRVEHGCDFVCLGHSRYESFARATSFHRKGLLQDKKIYPIGMMSKEQVFDLIKGRNIKVHPAYKFGKTTVDTPSYYKMRSAFILDPEYKKKMYELYPMLQLDEYRYEELFK